MWNIIVGIVALVIIGLGIYNIRSLIRKWKANPQHWFDLLMGIVIWGVAIGALIVIFIRYLPK
jgi:hypothetical protein